MNDYVIKAVSLEKAFEDANNQRVSEVQMYSRGIDTRSGSQIVSDISNRRIIIGVLPDGTYGIAISKEGVDVIKALGGQ